MVLGHIDHCDNVNLIMQFFPSAFFSISSSQCLLVMLKAQSLAA